MLDLSEITRKAREAPRQTTDVEVVFDAGVTSELETLRGERQELTQRLEDIDQSLTVLLENLNRDARAGDARPGKARRDAEKQSNPIQARLEEIDGELERVQERAADFLVTFRFTALHGFEWAELTSASVPRDGNAADLAAGYNIDDVCRVAATRSGVRVVDDSTVPVSADEWADVWQVAPAPSLNALQNAVWYLNDYAWVQARNQAVDAARKASTARQAATLPSPSDSGSTRDVSPGGNPPSSPSTSTTEKAA